MPIKLAQGERPVAECLSLALTEYKDPGNTKSIRKIAREHGVADSSLRARISGMNHSGQSRSREEIDKEQQRLSPEKENAWKDGSANGFMGAGHLVVHSFGL